MCALPRLGRAAPPAHAPGRAAARAARARASRLSGVPPAPASSCTRPRRCCPRPGAACWAPDSGPPRAPPLGFSSSSSCASEVGAAHPAGSPPAAAAPLPAPSAFCHSPRTPSSTPRLRGCRQSSRGKVMGSHQQRMQCCVAAAACAPQWKSEGTTGRLNPGVQGAGPACCRP